MRSIKGKESFNRIYERSTVMNYVLAIDVAKNKSMVSLISSCGEILIEPYEINHKLSDLQKLNERIEKFNIYYEDLTVFMESTSTYHLPVKRFFKENTLYEVCVINPIYSALNKRNLRKTKTDKQDCFNLADLFFSKNIKNYKDHEQYYINLNMITREYTFLTEECVKFKNRFRKLINLTFPEYEDLFKKDLIFSNTALKFIKKYPHSEIISNTRIDALANTMIKLNGRHSKYYLRKAEKIKETAKNSYSSFSKDYEIVKELVRTITTLEYIITQQDKIKKQLIQKAKRCYLFECINKIEGIGELTTSLIIGELKDINRFNNIKELTAYCGLDPSIRQSGSSINVRGHISKAGNRYIRKILYNTIQNIIRTCSKTNPQNDILLYYRKKRNEGKHHYVASIACTTKLLRRILVECKKQQIYM